MDVLAHIISRATVERIDVVFKKYLSGSLGMKLTGYYLNKNQLPNLVSLRGNQILVKLAILTHPAYALEGWDVGSSYHTQSPNLHRDGHFLEPTLKDYSKFTRMLIKDLSVDGEHLLSKLKSK